MNGATPLREGEVYVGCKRLLEDHGWVLLAGQPPNGRDHLPVVEIKWSGRVGIGSEGALRPDLIAARNSTLLLVECKPVHDDADAEKLRRVLRSKERRRQLLQELKQRRLFERRGLPGESDPWVRGMEGGLAHAGPVHPQPDLWVLSIRDPSGAGEMHPSTGG